MKFACIIPEDNAHKICEFKVVRSPFEGQEHLFALYHLIYAIDEKENLDFDWKNPIKTGPHEKIIEELKVQARGRKKFEYFPIDQAAASLADSIDWVEWKKDKDYIKKVKDEGVLEFEIND